ncbi:unnamed protein product [Trichogramma brassicae]|uniref:Integrase catalytic domain-containing protein n=1 Tax=Trichogramma brassicae TaxID=86971 RepID=A0A6H5IP93_9HYME|nr:unnamed protein product [Trichogramma brassicae]
MIPRFFRRGRRPTTSCRGIWTKHNLRSESAYCNRWNLNFKSHTEHKSVGAITSEEWLAAQWSFFHVIQRDNYAKKLLQLSKNHPVASSSSLRRLTPFICDRGLLRIGGRLQNAHLSAAEQPPVILPGDHILVRRWVEHIHAITLHGGIQVMRSYLRRVAWIIGELKVTKGVYYGCITCTRYAARGGQQRMAPLPISRVTPHRVFAHTGVDFAGPFPLRMSKGKGAKSIKGYVAIFVCMVWKAVHIEAVSDLTTDAFLAVYSRFTSRRGLCSVVYSDNGTTFKGASAELKRLFDQASQMSKDVAAHLATEGTKWSFIPPRAPNFGGLWEAAVRSFKFYLRRVIGDTKLTFEEMSTLAARIEACLNSRPLCALDSVPSAYPALTPGHFFAGTAVLAPPVPISPVKKLTPKNRWELLVNMRNSFWLRWRKEVLHQLQLVNKWHSIHRNFQPGDIVILSDDLTPPATWPLARITAVHPGSDGLVRVATIKTAKSEFVRPISKLIRLPTDERYEELYRLQKKSQQSKRKPDPRKNKRHSR